MAERIAPGTWSIQDQTVTLPVDITGARITAALFSASASDARKVLSGTPLRPFAVFGRAVSLLMALHYGPWALGEYDEVGVGLLALGPGRRPGLHIVDLPVTGAFTREAGQDFWALPKWLMTADLSFEASSTSVTVRDGGASVLQAVIRAGRLRLPFGIRASLPAWCYLDRGAQAGSLLWGRVPMNLSGVRVGTGGFDARLSSHPMTDRMRDLGMLGRPWLTVTARRLTGPLDEFRVVTATSAPSRG